MTQPSFFFHRPKVITFLQFVHLTFLRKLKRAPDEKTDQQQNENDDSGLS